MTETQPKIEQKIYERCLKDDRLRCTCDELIREDAFHSASSHYSHCMLHQVTRAINISIQETARVERERCFVEVLNKLNSEFSKMKGKEIANRLESRLRARGYELKGLGSDKQ
jgi:hypothetical protein